MSECSDRNDGAPLVGADTVAFTDDALASGRTLSAVDASSRRDPAEALHRLGRYVVIERLGAGGMGGVYAAYDPELDRTAAIKLLDRDTGDAQTQARLVREAQA
ncbi:MAG: hypothetical protein KC636_34630, partial [Myxococcales bacterium]|nr:hypothetical protein [Myxococcales bacterium]